MHVGIIASRLLQTIQLQKLDVSGISQLPRGLLPTMPAVLNSVQATSNSSLALDITVAFPPLIQQVSHRTELISKLNTQPGLYLVSASTRGLPHKTQHSRPRRLAKYYLVRNLHSLQSSGLCWRTVSRDPEDPLVVSRHKVLSPNVFGDACDWRFIDPNRKIPL